MSRDATDRSSGRRPSVEQLYAQLDDADPATLDRARSVAGTDADSWYLQTLAFGGAWLSAIFLAMTLVSLAGLLGVPDEIAEYWTTWSVAGAALLTGGLRLDATHGDNRFFGHFAGALAVAGLGCLTIGATLFGEALFIDLLGWEIDNWFGVALAGLLAVATLRTAVALRDRRDQGRVFPQLAFATSALGQGLAMVSAQGAYEQIWPETYHVSWSALLIAEASAAAVLYRYFDSDFHRFLTSLAVSLLAVAALFDVTGGVGRPTDDGLPRPLFESLLATVFALETAVVALVFSPSRWMPLSTQLSFRPVGYACALSIAALSSELFLLEFADIAYLWPYRGAVAAALIYLIYGAVHTSDSSALEPAIWGAGATLVLAVVSTPGVLVGLMLLFVGVWRLQGWFFTLGIVTLGFHLVVFYYLMELTLFDKSLMLMATGAVLLALRSWFARRSWYATETSL